MESHRKTTRVKALEIDKANNQFAVDMYANLRTAKGNLFFSPASIITALAMIYAGARGQTETQLKDTLRFPFPQEELHTVFAKWISGLINDAYLCGSELRIANALWGRKGYEFLQTFLEILTVNYKSELREINFDLPLEAANQINSWVAQQTENRIQNIVSPGIFNSLTRLVLTNAIYFKGAWDSPFSEDETHDAPFTLEDDSSSETTVQTSMMTIEENFLYSEGDNFQALELPFKIISEFSMIVFLPKKENISGFNKLFREYTDKNLLQTFEEVFTYESFTQWRPKHSKLVKVFLPKFKIGSDFPLSRTLNQLGIRDAFSPNAADFSGISEEKPLNISEVLHKAWIEINEEGAEAAAATVVVLTLSADVFSTKPPQPIIFRADHPFLFLICRHNDILFMGRVMNPLEG